MFGLSRHSVSRFCQLANPALVNSHRTWSIPVSTQSDFAVFPHEKRVPAIYPPVKVAFDWNTTEWVANGGWWPGKSTSLGQHVETPQISIGHELLHTTVGIIAVCFRNLVEDSMSWNRITLQMDQLREMCFFAYITFPGTLPG